ncbi:hypothetical protein NM208_g10499 [Fusarium decemcellulare]|uniref:Uncharacterized protein n=1 Tax=Fusarium decemcellulare TaxID=57161 RepID=A0ACC1RXN2_9HYPO|nr:hypothetical protein NM208_g10499 [Fusarium decemcellulare]
MSSSTLSSWDEEFILPIRQASQASPEAHDQRTFTITREEAMRRAGGLETKVGVKWHDQESLVPEMKRWLSKPVIMVLSEDMKAKVFAWCQTYHTSLLGVIFDAKGNDRSTYEYTASEESPCLTEPMYQALRTLFLGVPRASEATNRLWAFADEVMTHSQRVVLRDEFGGCGLGNISNEAREPARQPRRLIEPSDKHRKTVLIERPTPHSLDLAKPPNHHCQATSHTDNYGSISCTTFTMGQRLIEATYLMTREMAIEQANGLDQKLGHRDWDQALLAPEMTKWLSTPVIKVLSDDMKNKVFTWCNIHSPTWKAEILAAKDDLVEYRYTTAMEEPSALNHVADALQGKLSDMITNSKDELSKQFDDGIAKILAQVNNLTKPTEAIPSEDSSKRRRTDTDDTETCNLLERLRNLDEGLCLLFNEDSDFIKEFREVAVGLSPNFTAFNSDPGREPYYNEARLKVMRNERVHWKLGLGEEDMEILKYLATRLPPADKVRRNLQALAKSLTNEDQYKSHKWKW